MDGATGSLHEAVLKSGPEPTPSHSWWHAWHVWSPKATKKRTSELREK